jgi:hypothetical protein
MSLPAILRGESTRLSSLVKMPRVASGADQSSNRVAGPFFQPLPTIDITEPSSLSLVAPVKVFARYAALHLDCARSALGRSLSIRLVAIIT